MLTVDGDLRYDDKKAIYTISRSDPSDVNAYEGAALTYSDSTNRITFRGPLAFIAPSKDYRMIASGVGSANPDSARYAVDALLGIDFTMPAKAVDVMGGELAKITKNGPEAQNGSTNELYKLAQFIGDKATQSYAARSGVAGSIPQLSPKLAGHTLLLSQVNLRWNAKQRAWYSVGPIGLAGVGKQSLNALVTGSIEIRREDGGEVVEIYLEAEPQSWYYFKYGKNLMLTTSSSDNFNYEISSKAKYDYETATSYGVFLGALADVDAFRIHFQKDYLGKTGKQIVRTVAPAAPPEPVEPVDGKKKKKGKADDAFGTADDPAANPGTAEPAPEPTKKKKKAKANDPFGDGVLDDPAPAPAPAKKEKAKDKAADAPAPAKKEAVKEKADVPAAALPAADDAPDPAQAKKEADRQAKEAEKLRKEEEKKKKDDEKKKKKAVNDPFGDS